MGAWGTGPFENDAAMDFASEIDSLADIERALAPFGHDCIETDRASIMVAASECVSAMRGSPHPDMPGELAQRLSGLGTPSPTLVDSARHAVSVVITTSELSELWGESDDRAGYNRAMTDLIARLNQPADEALAVRAKPARNLSPCWFCDEEMGEEFTALSIILDPRDAMHRGGSVHLACLNAALHPKFIVQNWKFDDAAIDHLVNGMFGDRD